MEAAPLPLEAVVVAPEQSTNEHTHTDESQAKEADALHATTTPVATKPNSACENELTEVVLEPASTAVVASDVSAEPVVVAPVPIPVAESIVASKSSPKPATSAKPAPSPAKTESSGWDWFGWAKKRKESPAPSAPTPAPSPADANTNSDSTASRSSKTTGEQAAEQDHLGGTSHPWSHKLVRFSINKLFGFEEWEEGMEERYREVLCRELITMQTRSSQATEDPDLEAPPLHLEMSHYYPRGCHNTPLPVILIRTPYDRALMRHTAERICQHGYHCIIQDTRNSPNPSAMAAKVELAKLAAKKTLKMIAQEAENVRKLYAAKSPTAAKPAPSPDAKMDEMTLPAATEAAADSAAKSAGTSPKQSSGSPSSRSSEDGCGSPVASDFPPFTSAPAEFFPIAHESIDGLATLDWVSKQPWCDGNISFYGASYLGIATYAVVDHKHPALKCIVPVASASRIYNILYPEGALNLDLAARWLYMMFNPNCAGPSLMEGELPSSLTPPSFWQRSYARVIGSRSVIPKALDHLPASELDRMVTEQPLSFYQEMIRNGHDEGLPFWRDKQTTLCDLANAPPLLIVEGWYDLFLQQALHDYQDALRLHKEFQAEVTAGKYTEAELASMPASVRTFRPYLTILNCAHIDFKHLYRISLTESIKWFDFFLKGKAERLIDRPAEKSVRVQMIHASGGNQERHQTLIARRRKRERQLIEHGAAAVQAGSPPDAAGLPAEVVDLLSPRSKSRWRQSLLDAEWRAFPEFPPPNARKVSYFLYCDIDDTGAEQRVLRTEAPGEREAVRALRRAARKRTIDSRLAALSDADAAATKEPLAAESQNAAAPAAAAEAVASAASSLPPAGASRPPSTSNLSISIPPSGLCASTAPIFPTQSYSCYTYDPKDPTPAIGGTTFHVENSGPLDNRPVESRADVLIFTSEPLAAPLVVVGFVRCTLYVRSNVPCTDFVARLCDVFPLDDLPDAGKSQVLCDGLFRVTPTKIDSLTVEPPAPAKPRASSADLSPPPVASASSPSQGAPSPPTDFAAPFFPISAPDPATPLLKLDIDMWATGNVFQVGHRIRFHVCSAAHPRWLRSLGGPDPMFHGLDHALLQHQTVYHDAQYPSALVLPVLPE